MSADVDGISAVISVQAIWKVLEITIEWMEVDEIRREYVEMFLVYWST